LARQSHDIAEPVNAGERGEVDTVARPRAGGHVEDGVGAVTRRFDEGIVVETTDQRVIAAAAVEDVAPGAAIQRVVATEAAQRIRLIGRAYDRRQAEDVAAGADVDDVEIASAVLAE